MIFLNQHWIENDYLNWLDHLVNAGSMSFFQITNVVFVCISKFSQSKLSIFQYRILLKSANQMLHVWFHDPNLAPSIITIIRNRGLLYTLLLWWMYNFRLTLEDFQRQFSAIFGIDFRSYPKRNVRFTNLMCVFMRWCVVSTAPLTACA